MKTPEQWIVGEGLLQIHMRNVIAEVQADCFGDPQGNSLLLSCYHEIINLQNKLARQEREGWEGTCRREILRKEIERYLKIKPKIVDTAPSN